MPRVLLEVEARGHTFMPALMESEIVQAEHPYRSGPAVVTWRSGDRRRAWGDFEVGQFVVEWASGESLTMVAGWLFAKAHGKVQRMWINRREVRVEEGDILGVLREANADSDRAEGDGK